MKWRGAVDHLGCYVMKGITCSTQKLALHCIKANISFLFSGILRIKAQSSDSAVKLGVMLS